MIDVIIPTLGKPHAIEAFKTLHHLPFPIRLHVITDGENWAQAINIGLERSTGDVLIMDDDVRLLEDTFKDFDKYKDLADIIGFKLLFEDGRIQHAGGFYSNGGLGHIGFGQRFGHTAPYFVFHCTASLLYIKRHVLEKVGSMSEFGGQQFEDVDFSVRAIKEGFKILYNPNKAYHLESASKGQSADFQEKMNLSYGQLMAEHGEYLQSIEGEFPVEI